MPNDTATFTPQVSLKLSAELFSDDANFDVKCKDQFLLFTCQMVALGAAARKVTWAARGMQKRHPDFSGC
ncbi:MAG: hypothetical protein P8P65_09135, partial [Planktotalea sp.]|uniref:hypothetical protein n=1 Tax=Planktotalea sp. TaxID=2029877 RepID=UPI0026107A84